jgi:hypothetical protein
MGGRDAVNAIATWKKRGSSWSYFARAKRGDERMAQPSKFADVLPPCGAPRSPQRRLYRTIWMRAKREREPDYYQRELDQQMGRTDPKPRPRRDPEPEPQEPRAKCFFCGGEARTTTEREGRVNGKPVTVKVPYCGKC